MKTITKDEAQAVRVERAQAAAYGFRLVDVKTNRGPVPVVFVFSGETIYTVHSGSRCSCMDSQRRGLNPESKLYGVPCKHAVAVASWLENGTSLEVSAESIAAGARLGDDPFTEPAKVTCGCGALVLVSELRICERAHVVPACRHCRFVADASRALWD